MPRHREIHHVSPSSLCRAALLRWAAFVVVSVSPCLLGAAAGAEESATRAPEEKTVVEAGSMVGIEYQLSLEDGTEVDGNVGEEALRFEQGAGQIIPGLDAQLLGMHVGESKQVTVAAADGYGEIHPEAFVEVPLEQIPEDAREVGTELAAQDPQGRIQRMRVHKVEGDVATLDLNHPLAGKTLIFQVKIVDVGAAAAP